MRSHVSMTKSIPLVLVWVALAATITVVRGASLQAPDDNFGYSVQNQAFSWVDATITGTLAAFPSSDNSYTSLVPLGFSFPFYENTYSQVFISTNGIVTFDAGSLIPINQPIPFPGDPNNFVAPFWADLDVGGVNAGAVYYQTRGAAPNRMFVIAYENVTLVSSPSDALTFEVLFHENGDVCFQYASLAGDLSSAVGGIEDEDGVDGVDQTGAIAPNTHFCFVRPPDAARVKISPTTSGGFVENGVRSFVLTVKNTGSLGTDTYDLSFSSSQPGWSVDFFLAGTNLPLADSDASGIADTGPLAPGETVDIGVTVTAPGAANEGDDTQITVTATSQLDPGVDASAQILVAVPVSFAQLYRDSQTGVRLQLQSQDVQLVTPPLAPGSPSGLSLAAAGQGNYFVFWESNYLNNNFQFVTDIEFSLVGPTGAVLASTVKLTNNSLATMRVQDRFAAAAGNANGKLGVVFIRDVFDDSVSPSEVNSNVYFQVLNPDGSTAAGPVNLTQNTDFRGEGEFDEPVYETPRVAAAGSAFMVTWLENRLQQPLSEEDDVVIMVLDETGAAVLGLTKQADSTPGGDLYLNPIVAGLSGSRSLLLYARTDSTGVNEAVLYAVRDSSGAVVKGETTLAGALGAGLDAVELSGGNILVAWIDATTTQLKYALLNSSFNLVFGPAALATPEGRDAATLSVTSEDGGRAVITWADGTSGQNLYYALINPNGSVETASLPMRTVSGFGQVIFTSSNGGGNAPFGGASSIFLPVVLRE